MDIIKFITSRQLTLVLPYSLGKYCKTRKIYMTQQSYTIYTYDTEIPPHTFLLFFPPLALCEMLNTDTSKKQAHMHYKQICVQSKGSDIFSSISYNGHRLIRTTDTFLRTLQVWFSLAHKHKHKSTYADGVRC